MAQKPPSIIITTSMGAFTIELFADKAPITVANFLQYVDSGYYAGTLFHRVIPSFMIQGGGLTEGLRPRPGKPPIKNESALSPSNTRGTLAMARTDDADSATSQFFVNLVDNTFLDHSKKGAGYAVFGKVVAGMEVVDAIAGVATSSQKGHDDVPRQMVEIISAARAPLPA